MRGLLVIAVAACTPVKGEAPGNQYEEPTLVSIEVTQETATMKRVLSPPQQLKARALYSDNSTKDVSSVATWSSSDPNLATVTAGMVTVAPGTTPGAATISAELDGVQGMAQVAIEVPTLVVAQYQPPRLDFFSVFDNGDVPPMRSISGASIMINTAWSVAVHGNELYVVDADGFGINVYPLDASGDVAPVRRIAGDATGLTRAYGIAVTADEIYVTGSGPYVLVFPRTANGNVVPRRAISGPATQLGGSQFGIDIHNGELYVVVSFPAAINVYPLDATGNVAPTRRIAGAATLLQSPHYVRARGPEIYVQGASFLHVFPSNGTGDIPPLRSIDTPDNTYGLFLFGDELIIPAYSDKSVLTHPTTAQGTAAPVRRITGAMTKIEGPLGAFAY